MPCYTWSQIVKQGFKQLLVTAQTLGVLDQVVELRRRNPVGVYLKCCSVVHRAQKNQSVGEFKYYATLAQSYYFQFNRVSSRLTFHESQWKECCAIAINSAKVWKRYYYVSRDGNGFLKITDHEPQGSCARVDAAARVFVRV